MLTLDDNEVLKIRGLNKDRTDRILIPDDHMLKAEVFSWSHEHPSAGHFGQTATLERARLHFYYPGMGHSLKKLVKNCETCLQKMQQTNLKDTVHKPHRYGYPGEVLFLDLVGPMPETHDGMKYILTFQDGFSKYVCTSLIPCKEAAIVANRLIEDWICLFGVPTRIHTDQGKEFHNNLWTELCDRLQVKKTVTPPYNPQSNPVERFHRTLNQILRLYMDRQDREWPKIIRVAVFAYNTKANSSTGVTPFEAWMGRRAKLPIDMVLPTPGYRYENEQEYINETLNRFHIMYRYIRKKNEQTIQRNATQYTGATCKYAVDDLVWAFTKRRLPGKPQKITLSWTGPYSVVSMPSDVLVDI